MAVEALPETKIGCLGKEDMADYFPLVLISLSRSESLLVCETVDRDSGGER